MTDADQDQDGATSVAFLPDEGAWSRAAAPARSPSA